MMEYKHLLWAEGDKYRVECELVIWALPDGTIRYQVKDAAYLGDYQAEAPLVGGIIQAYESGDQKVTGIVTPLESKADPDLLVDPGGPG